MFTIYINLNYSYNHLLQLVRAQQPLVSYDRKVQHIDTAVLIDVTIKIDAASRRIRYLVGGRDIAGRIRQASFPVEFHNKRLCRAQRC